jgi:nucleotide-binding universal stress UspA family protein
MFRKVLLCYDGSAEGRRALRQGADIAITMKAEAFLLAICRSLPECYVPEGVTPYFLNERESRARALLDEGVAWLRDRGVSAEGALVEGDAIPQIAQTASRIGADLIVVGHRARGPLARWWSSSDEESLLEQVNCSVLAAVADDS